MARCKQWLRSNLLLLLTVASVLIGVIVGLETRKYKPSQRIVEIFAFPGELFMRMLQMAVLPLVTSSIMTGLATLDARTSKRIFILSFSYYAVSTVVAIGVCFSSFSIMMLFCLVGYVSRGGLIGGKLGIILVVLIAPGYRTKLEGSESDDFLSSSEEAQLTTRDAFFDLLRNMFPENMAEACVKQCRTVYKKQEHINERNETVTVFTKVSAYTRQINIMGIITISITVGIILGRIKETSQPLIECLSVVDQITTKMIMIVMWYSPLGIASLIAGKLLEIADVWRTLSALGFYMVTVMSGFVIQMFIIQPLMYFVLTRRDPFAYMRGLIQVWLTAFVTASSAATLPVTIRCCEHNLHIDQRVTRFVLPVGATVNMNGEALYEAVSAIFIAQLTGWELNPVRLIMISLVATLGSIGAAAVPSAGAVTVVVALNAVGLGTRHMAMILAVDWFIDRVRTSVNVIGDAFTAGVVQYYCSEVLQRTNITTEEAQTRKQMNINVQEVGVGGHMLLQPFNEQPSGKGDVIDSYDYHLKSNDGDEFEPQFATRPNDKQGNETSASYITESNSRKGSLESDDNSNGSRE